MRGFDEMVAKGRNEMSRKVASMKENYDAMKPTMKAGYGDTPFGPKKKAHYNTGIDAAVHRADVEKWARNWRAKMSI